MLKIDARIRRGSTKFDFRADLKGSAIGVVGASGAGKTTFLLLIAGLLEPDQGKIEVLGRTVFDSEKGINIPAHRRKVGCVFQDSRLFPHLDVEANIRYGERFHSASERRFDFEHTIDLLGVSPLLSKRTTEISGGERQRVALARTLMASPQLILLDEPLSSLDQQRRAQLLPFLSTVQDELKIPMLHVSHNLHEVLQLTDQLLVIHDNCVAGVGSFMDLVHERVLLKAPFTKGLCNVWPMRLIRSNQDAGNCLLSTLGSHAVQINGPLTSMSSDSDVRVLFNADDVALALEPVSGVSIRNQFPAIMKRHIVRDGTVYCELEVTPTAKVLVEISVGAFNELQMDELSGRPVYCLLKVGAMRIEAAQ